MAVPGLDWLRARLDTADAVSGGYQADMGHPVMGAAGVRHAALSSCSRGCRRGCRRWSGRACGEPGGGGSKRFWDALCRALHCP